MITTASDIQHMDNSVTVQVWQGASVSAFPGEYLMLPLGGDLSSCAGKLKTYMATADIDVGYFDLEYDISFSEMAYSRLPSTWEAMGTSITGIRAHMSSNVSSFIKASAYTKDSTCADYFSIGAYNGGGAVQLYPSAIYRGYIYTGSSGAGLYYGSGNTADALPTGTIVYFRCADVVETSAGTTQVRVSTSYVGALALDPLFTKPVGLGADTDLDAITLLDVCRFGF
jgi:hypothetical protein